MGARASSFRYFVKETKFSDEAIISEPQGLFTFTAP